MNERVVKARSERTSLRTEVVVIVLMSVALSGGCVQDAVEPLSVPLEYRTMVSTEELALLPDCGAVSEVVVIDVRNDPVLGERFNEDLDGSTVAVTTSSNVAEWVRTGVEEMLTTSGVALGTSGAPVLRIEVERIRTIENVHRRAGYEGRISFSAGLVARADEDSFCWLRQSNGTAENYGFAGSSENYQETLNHALDRAMIALIDSPGFRHAVCEGCK